MSLNLSRSGWRRVRLGDVVRRSRTQVNPLVDGVERYVAGGHIDTDSVIIDRFADPTDGQMGSTFRYAFKPGQVLFVSARPYLRKTGVPDFAGVVADKTYVLFAIPENGLLHELLPFLLTSEPFITYANQEATGSMNPRLLWGAMQRYEFDLPPHDEQIRLANILWSVERHRRSVLASVSSAQHMLATVRAEMFDEDSQRVRATEAFSITIGRQRSPRHEEGENMVPYLRSANVTASGIDVHDVKSMNFSPIEQAKFALAAGDVLVSEASASQSAVGMPAVWNDELLGVVCFQNTLLRFRAVDGVSLPGFAEQWCRWAFETGRFLAAASGTNIRHIGVGGATAMSVRLPVLEDQSAFLERTAFVSAAVAATERERACLAALGSALSIEIFGGK